MKHEFSGMDGRVGQREGRFGTTVLLALLLTSGISARADWPEFRGPRGDGYVSAPGESKPVGLPLHWDETKNIKWKTPIPFHGQSTPVIAEGKIWVTTATEDGTDLYALCLDAESGQVLIDEKVFHTDQPEPLGNGKGMNCYATPTALLEKGKVYVHFGSPFTACLDAATGKALWTREDLHCRHYRGPSSSVVSFENLIVLTFDGADQQYLVALDKATGFIAATCMATSFAAVSSPSNSTTTPMRVPCR